MLTIYFIHSVQVHIPGFDKKKVSLLNSKTQYTNLDILWCIFSHLHTMQSVFSLSRCPVHVV